MPLQAEWVDRVCPLCSSADTSHVFAEANIDLSKLDGFAFASRKLPEYMHPRLIECSGCGILYGSPVLSPETLAAAYRAADFDSAPEAGHASATYAAEVRGIDLPQREAALDIGTGDGSFLEELLELGFRKVAGVEPSSAPIAAAKPAIRPHIRHGLFRGEDFEAASFSLVTCFQTMEHVPDPLGIACSVRDLLVPGGAFAIVVHNRRALSAKLLGTKSPIFDIEHLQLFCPRTARDLFERAGYTRVSVRPLWNRYSVRYWLRLFPLPPRVKRGVLRIVNASGVGGTVLPAPAGNLICIGFKG
jgi:SAM-dependent methyltransferase